MNNGTVAIAIVRNQVMIVQAARSHSRRDRFLEVYTYTPFGDRVFLATNVPSARIMSSDILTVFSAMDKCCSTAPGMLELPQKAFSQYLDLSSRNQKRHERIWNAWTAAH